MEYYAYPLHPESPHVHDLAQVSDAELTTWTEAQLRDAAVTLDYDAWNTQCVLDRAEAVLEVLTWFHHYVEDAGDPLTALEIAEAARYWESHLRVFRPMKQAGYRQQQRYSAALWYIQQSDAPRLDDT